MRRKISFRANTTPTSPATVINIENAIEENNLFRRILWTGEHLQVTIMNVNTGGEIGVEMHPDFDQFIKIDSGRARVIFGTSPTEFNYERLVDDDYAIMIPAGTWHNVINAGDEPLKLFSIYAPPHHAVNT